MHKLSAYFIALIVTVFTANTARAQQAIPPLPELQFAEIQAKEKFTGDRWSYMEAGPKDAPVIVTLHGLGDNAMQWRFQLAGLSDRFRVIAWNAPGYMLTDGFKTERPGCGDYADALADFLDALKLTRVNLLGNSFGSRVSQCFAMNYPARLNKMVFAGPSAGRKGMTQQEKDQLIAGRKEQIAQGGYNFPGKRVSALLNSKATPELIELTSYAMRATNPRAFMHGSYFAIAEGYSPEEVGAKVTAPLLLIVGDEDRISPFTANAEPLHKAIRGSRLEILKGIGHLPHVEAPEKVNQLAREFFGGGTNQSHDESAQREVTQREKEWREAWVRSDATTLDRLHAEDYFSINNIGQRSTKAQVMADVRAGLFKYESMEHKDVVLRVYGDVVIVNGLTINKGHRGERDVSGEFSFTRVYVKRNGLWQAVLAQYTRLAQAVDPSLFVGVWKLVSVTATNTDGTRNEAPWGTNPKGTIVYTREGWMTAVINYGGRKPLSTVERFRATTEEKATAYETSFSYAGRYEIKDDKVIHHVEIASVENWVKTDLIRNFRLQGNRLTLLTPPLPSPQGQAANFELTWERVK